MNQILAAKVTSVSQFIFKPLCCVSIFVKEFDEYSCGIKTHTACPHNNNNNNNNVIPVIIGATGTISKSFRKYVSNIPGNLEVKKLHKTAILGTAQIFRKVLT
jgi:hypothetical protein